MSKAKWTIFVYIAAHNNLQANGEDSCTQIWEVGSSSDLKLTMLLDTYSDARIYTSSGPNDGKIKKADDFDSGNPNKLLAQAKQAFGQFPAERYGLVLWSHGTGWMPNELRSIAQSAGNPLFGIAEANDRAVSTSAPALFRSTLTEILSKPSVRERAICFDDGSQHSIDTVELEKVTQGIAAHIGQPLDLLGMDACLMASLEVAYQLRKTVRYMVASEELVPASSWPYGSILGALKANPSMSVGDVATLIADQYYQHYKGLAPKNGDVTQVALDLAHVDEIGTAADVLAGELLADMTTQRRALWTAQERTQSKETIQGKRARPFRGNKFDLQLWDLGTVARELAKASQNARVQAAAGAVLNSLAPGRAVLRERHSGAWLDGIGGVSVYLPPKNVSRITPYYPTVAFAKDTRWNDMLTAYQAG